MMHRTRQSWSERAYRVLLHLHPSELRELYGDEMAEYFRDRMRDERRRAGARGMVRLWRRALADLLTVAVREHVERITKPRPTYLVRQPTGDGMLQNLAHDLRFSGRMIRQNPVLTAPGLHAHPTP